MQANFLRITPNELRYERQQALEEGKQISDLDREFTDLMEKLNEDASTHQTEAKEFLDRVQDLDQKSEYPYREPSELAEIQKSRPDGPRTVDVELSSEDLQNRFLGAWLGRCCGCLLGKPVEAWELDRMEGYLKDLDRFPLRDYFRSDVPEEVYERYRLGDLRPYMDAFANDVECMPRDDDIEYTIMGLDLLSSKGLDIQPDDFAEYWLENIPAYRLFVTARVAYRNFLNLYEPPNSAFHRNPYREAIGAQIRADFYGYAALGDPEMAAKLAWKDASISHVKNGLYGPMWIAAMLSVAPKITDMANLIRVGLSEIPAQSRFTDGIEQVLEWYEDGLDYDSVVTRLHQHHDEANEYERRHVITNAKVVAIGLLWGEKDFELSICRSVQAGFDGDCNAASVGSIIGLMVGADNIPDKWTAPLDGRVKTMLPGHRTEQIDALADSTLDIHQEIKPNLS